MQEIGGQLGRVSAGPAGRAETEEAMTKANLATRESTTGTPVAPWVVLALVCLGQFMVVLDISIVNVALPSIQSDLGFSASALQWVVNAYTLTFAGFLLLGGRAADLFGRRRMFLVGLGMFTAASFLGGIAQSQGMLIVARALQGLGGAVLAPATLTIITTTFTEGAARARALGVWSAVAAAGASAGALLGGILTDFMSWRWILFVNVPIGVVALIVARAYLPESRADVQHRRLDVGGAVTVTGGLVALVYAIVRSQQFGWGSSEVLVPLLAGLALLGAFALVEGRLAVSPLVPFRIFRSRSVTGGNVFIMLFFAAMFGAWYFETLYMQHVLGFSPLAAGLAFLPQTLLIAAGSQFTSRLVMRYGTRPLLIIGSLVGAAGLAWLSRITPSSTFLADLLGPYVLIGAGFGLSVTPVVVAATSGVRQEDAGLASGLLNTARIVGAAIGLAALSTIAADRTAGALAGIAAPSASVVSAAFTAGFARALDVGAIILVVTAFVAAAAIPALRGPAPSEPVRAPEQGTDLDAEIVSIVPVEKELESA
jgi:EmrB/QacA subfamily drug resistance transporter